MISTASARCRSWDYGAPSLCASLRLDSLKRKEDESCYFMAEVQSYTFSDPKLKQSEVFENLVREKKLHLVKISKDICEKIGGNNEIQGLIVGECHDNIGDVFFGLERFFRKLFKKEKLYADFRLVRSAELVHVENGKSVTYTATCKSSESKM